MIKALLVLLAVLFSTPAFAANGWFRNPDCTGTADSTLSDGRPVYYCTDANAATPSFLTPALYSGKLQVFVTRLGDTTGSAAGACEGKLFAVASKPGVTPASVTGLAELSGDATGDNVQDDLTMSGAVNRRGVGGWRPVHVALQITVKATGSQQCVFVVVGAE